MTKARHEQLESVLSKACRDPRYACDPRDKHITVKRLKQAIKDFMLACNEEQERLDERSRVTADIYDRFIRSCSYA